ncbi:uncharacterized protein LOC119903594 [Micropterus salmoides]|uniref:uncharacterized protein LOC119903594 n=1 Tax=Micropterus salmoides TaxID=27706 RepID=UPI0018EE2140|nr:uncharacterized protein LOC119903594 [Micropterus salmoides]
MFDLNQAALLSIQLLVTYQVFAGTDQVDHRDVLVFRGEPVMFTCNISNESATQITWTKGRSVFSYSIIRNMTFSNLTSHSLRIDQNSPLKLNIFNAQHEDAGLYTCNVTSRYGPKTTEWNLTVSEKREEISPSWYFLYILISIIGLLPCGLTSAVCLCRKHGTRTTNQYPVQDQFHLQSGGEVVIRQQQGGTGSRTNNRQSSQYAERLNSIYGLY